MSPARRSRGFAARIPRKVRFRSNRLESFSRRLSREKLYRFVTGAATIVAPSLRSAHLTNVSRSFFSATRYWA